MKMDDGHYTGEPKDKSDPVIAAPAFDLVPGTYLDELSGLEMTEAQKIELLQTLWDIMRGFVELGFSVDICAQLFGAEPDDLLPGTGEGIDSSDSPDKIAKERRQRRYRCVMMKNRR